MPKTSRKHNILIIISIILILIMFSVSEIFAIEVVEYGEDRHGSGAEFTPQQAYSVQDYGYNGDDYHSIDCIHVCDITVHRSAIDAIPADQQGQELFIAATSGTQVYTRINNKTTFGESQGDIVYGEDYSVATPSTWATGPNTVNVIVHSQDFGVSLDIQPLRMKKTRQISTDAPISESVINGQIIKPQYVLPFTVTVIDDVKQEDPQDDGDKTTQEPQDYQEPIGDTQVNNLGSLGVTPGISYFMPAREMPQVKRPDAAAIKIKAENGALTLIKRADIIYMISSNPVMADQPSAGETVGAATAVVMTIVIAVLIMSILSDLAVLSWYAKRRRK